MQVPVYEIHSVELRNLSKAGNHGGWRMAGMVRAQTYPDAASLEHPRHSFLHYYLGTLDKNLVIGVGCVLDK